MAITLTLITLISSRDYLALMLLRRIRMSKFDILTKYIPMIQTDSFGEWVIDKENDGTPEHPIQMP